jgi:tRNA dimethylallyltransferase
MKSLGYRQMAGFLEGEYGFEEAVRRLKRDTRHFAKRQMTWFRKEPNIEWLQISHDEAVLDITKRVLDRINQFLRSIKANAYCERSGSPKPIKVGR